MNYTYKTHGTCSRQIDFSINDEGIITDVKFYGGCNGNLQGIARLVAGKKASEVSSILKGVNCNGKGTSCPDQLSKAIDEALAK